MYAYIGVCQNEIDRNLKQTICIFALAFIGYSFSLLSRRAPYISRRSSGIDHNFYKSLRLRDIDEMFSESTREVGANRGWGVKGKRGGNRTIDSLLRSLGDQFSSGWHPNRMLREVQG